LRRWSCSRKLGKKPCDDERIPISSLFGAIS
jgi:hypothetical protein